MEQVAAARTVLEPGSRIDHFRVIRLLGEGGFGEVYLARDVKLGRKVALKVIHPRHVGSREAIDRFLFEVRATARFNHPNIVTVYAVGEHEGVPYVALEYLQGQTLRQRVHERRPTAKEALRIGSAIARALEEAHQHNIIHRDLKPENVLIPADGRVRVLDFGLAKKIAGGAPAERDPSMRSEPIEVDASVDGAGAIAATIATPSKRPDADAIARQIAGADTIAPEAFGDGVADTLADALAFDSAAVVYGDAPTEASHPDAAQVQGDEATEASSAGANDAATLPPNDSEALAAAVALGVERDTVENLTLASYRSEDNNLVRGTPAYMAPEQWRGQHLVAATDVWALGVMLYELLAGKLPYPYRPVTRIPMLVCGPDPAPALPSRVKVSSELADLISSCMAKRPAERPSARTVAEALEAMVAGGVDLADEQGPFRGLLAFSERHAGLYFGRDAEVAAFLERLRAQPSVAVVGPSGAGKSSFIHAGVVPRLREQGRWVVLSLRPGAAPFRALASRLRHGERSATATAFEDPDDVSVPEAVAAKPADGSSPDARAAGAVSDQVSSQRTLELVTGLATDDDALARALYDTPERLALLLRQLAEAHQAKVLLLVDQLEELHTLGDDGETRRRFMRALAGAADDPLDPVRVVTTLRDDFLGKLAEGGASRGVLSNIVVLRAPDPGALVTILERPLSVFGYGYDDPELPRQMVADVGEQSAALPLLSFTARMLWERRDRSARVLRRADYERIGGVAGALASHADAVLDGMAPAELDVARQILLRLVTSEGTRRGQSAAALLDGLAEAEGERVLDKLTAARLLAVRKPDSGEEPHYELAHESLIRSWRRLAQWLDQSAEERAFLHDIEQASTLWSKRGERPEEVWRDEALADALKTLGRIQDPFPALARRFIEAAVAERDVRATALARRRRRRRVTIALLVTLVIVVGVVVAAAWIRTLSRKEAHARVLLGRALAEASDGARARGDVPGARAQARRALEVGDSPLARMVLWRLGRKRKLWQRYLGSAIHDLAVGHRGRVAFAATRVGVVYRIDVERRSAHKLALGGDVTSVSPTPDGRTLVYTLREQHKAKRGRRRVLSKIYSAPLARLRKARLIAKVEGQIDLLRFSADGRTFCSRLDVSKFGCWDLASGKRLLSRSYRRLIGFTMLGGSIRAAGMTFKRFHPAGFTVTDYTPDKRGGVVERKLGEHRHRGLIYPVAFSRSGKFVAMGMLPYRYRRGDTGGGVTLLGKALEPLGTVILAAPPTAIAFDGDKRMAVGSRKGNVSIYEVPSGRLLRSLDGLEDWIRELRFTRDGRRLFAATRGGLVTLWDSTPGVPEVDTGHTNYVTSQGATSDGRLVVTGSADGRLRFWDGKTGMLRLAVKWNVTYPTALAVSPDEKLLAVGAATGGVHLVKVEQAHRFAHLGSHQKHCDVLTFSNDGSLLASGGRGGMVVLWDVKARRKRRVLLQYGSWVHALAFSPDGSRLAIGGGARWKAKISMRIVDVATGALIKSIKMPAGLRSLAFSTNEHVQVVSGLGQVFTVDLGSGKLTPLIRNLWVAGPISNGVFEGGRHTLVVVPSARGHSTGLRVYDMKRRVIRPLPGHRTRISGLTFARGGKYVVSSSTGLNARLWNVKTMKPMWHTSVALPDKNVFYTPRSRVDGTTGKRTVIESGPAWLRRARKVALYSDVRGDEICLVTFGNWLEVWRRGSDRRVLRVKLPGVAVNVWRNTKMSNFDFGYKWVAALGRGRCGLATDVKLLVADARGKLHELGPATRAGHVGATLWRYHKRKLHLHRDGARKPTRSLNSISVVTAVLLDGDDVLVATKRAMREVDFLMRLRAGVEAKRVMAVKLLGHVTNLARFKLHPTMPPLVWVSTGSGHTAIVDIERRTTVGKYRMPGAVINVWRHGNAVVAVSDSGQHRAVDISPLTLGYCELMRRVWASTKRVWDGRGAVYRPPPKDHPCRR